MSDLHDRRSSSGRSLNWALLFWFVCLGAVLRAVPAENPVLKKLEQLKRTNIILIVADDLGYGDLGCYGQQKIKTPNLDRLAAEGMRFTQFYSGSTVCAPSRACLMTGLHTGHARIRGNAAVPLQPEDVTLAEVVLGAGYKTGAVGKWALGLENTPGMPTRQGFEEFYGFLNQTLAHNYYPTELFRNETPRPLDRNRNGQKGIYVQDHFTMVASNFVRISQYGPFFLYLAYTIPHANNELGKQTGNGMEVPSDAPYTREVWPQPEKNKAAMITRLDRDVGALLQQLKKIGIDDHTVILFTSDNGPHQEGGVNPAFFQSSGPLRGIKRDLYEGGIRVPMIVRWPARVKAGVVSDQVWAMWDILPTVAEIVGRTPPAGIDGISMLPTLLGQKQTNQHGFLYWEFHERGSRQAVRTGDWKAIRPAVGAPLELYDLKTDLGETNNVAAAHADVVGCIETHLKTARTESERWPLRPPPSEEKSSEK